MSGELGPQLCTQCPSDAGWQAVESETTGWGTEGNLTMVRLACGHMFLLHTNYDGS